MTEEHKVGCIRCRIKTFSGNIAKWKINGIWAEAVVATVFLYRLRLSERDEESFEYRSS